MPVLVGVADDFTGASDQASMLAGAGVRSLLVLDESYEVAQGEWGAITYASRLRSIDIDDARALAAKLFVLARGLDPNTVQYKYCSTFDSTPDGNIGPCLDVGLEVFDSQPGAVVVPALPVNGRTTYQGHHFVLGVPIHESPMKDHPLNPMTDANLVRWLGHQTSREVGLVSYDTVETGPEAILAAVEDLWSSGVSYVVIDCLMQVHVRSIAEAVWDMPLISGSSALPMELPAIWRRQGLLGAPEAPSSLGSSAAAGAAPVLALAGSCAAQTLRQIEQAEGFTVIPVDFEALISGATERAAQALADEIAVALRTSSRALVTSSQAPAARAHTEAQAAAAGLDQRELGQRIERLMGCVAEAAVREVGIRHLLVAGGETSGAVCQRLGVRAVEIIREIDPGVPLCRSLEEPRVVVALKAGNFGADNFFPRSAVMATSATRPNDR